MTTSAISIRMKASGCAVSIIPSKNIANNVMATPPARIVIRYIALAISNMMVFKRASLACA